MLVLWCWVVYCLWVWLGWYSVYYPMWVWLQWVELDLVCSQPLWKGGTAAVITYSRCEKERLKRAWSELPSNGGVHVVGDVVECTWFECECCMTERFCQFWWCYKVKAMRWHKSNLADMTTEAYWVSYDIWKWMKNLVSPAKKKGFYSCKLRSQWYVGQPRPNWTECPSYSELVSKWLSVEANIDPVLVLH